MEYKDKLSTLESLKEQFVSNSLILDDLWDYHPSNPDFINPIKAYDKINVIMVDLERRIKSLEREINSLN